MSAAPTIRLAGRSRWTVWGVLALVYVVSYFHRTAPTVLAKNLMADFSATGAQMATLAALYLYTFAALQFVVGAVVDAWGPRRVVTGGALLMAAGAAAFALARALPEAYAARVVIGAGASVVFIATLKLVAAWFRPNEFATLAGLTQLAGNTGALLSATPLAWAVADVGWRPTLAGVAAATAALALLVWLVVEDRPGGPAALPLPRFSFREGYASVWKNPKTWPMFFIFFGIYGTLMVFAGLWGVPFLRDVHGLDAAAAAGAMSALAIGVIVGAPLVGHLSDKVLARRRLPYAAWTGAYTGLWAVLAFRSGGPPVGLLLPFCFLFGFTSAGMLLTWALAREVNRPRFSGIATATVNAGGFLGAAVLQNAVGAMLDARWTGAIQSAARRYPAEAYRAGFLLCFAAAGAAFVLTFFVTETHARPRPD
jgi:sugar phosphate permease